MVHSSLPLPLTSTVNLLGSQTLSIALSSDTTMSNSHFPHFSDMPSHSKSNRIPVSLSGAQNANIDQVNQIGSLPDKSK